MKSLITFQNYQLAFFNAKIPGGRAVSDINAHPVLCPQLPILPSARAICLNFSRLKAKLKRPGDQQKLAERQFKNPNLNLLVIYLDFIEQTAEKNSYQIVKSKKKTGQNRIFFLHESPNKIRSFSNLVPLSSYATK